MNTDKIPAKQWVTPDADGDIRLEKGRTQEYLSVGLHSTVRNRS